MPSIAYGNVPTREYQALAKDDHGYDYPGKLNLKPGSELHDDVRDRILERAQASASQLSSRFESWREMDQFLTAYKYNDDDEKDVQADDSRKPVSIVFPYSYAILETLLSYMIAAFFQDPIFRYEGYGPNDVMGAILLEKVVNLHANKSKIMLNLHTMFRDAFSYGIGVVAPIWKDGRNALENVDPYLYLPDPSVPADKIQEGEFVGWVNQTNFINLLEEEQRNDDLFNVKYLSGVSNKSTSVYGMENSSRNIRTGLDKSTVTSGSPVDEINMYINIIPSDWGLSGKDVPEKWFFRLAADNVILAARPAGFKHGKYPIAVISPDFDGYSTSPLSRLEILGGLQGILDWLFNSHIANVRKAINDVLIYDPYLVNGNDLADPKPGKLVRIRRNGWGKGVKDAVQQLAVNDITRANINDSTWIVQWMQKIGATDDAAMGALRSGGPERLTKAEFQGTSGGAISRLERIAKVAGLQGMQDIGEFFAAHTQQLLTDTSYVKIAGDWETLLMEEYADAISRGRMIVSPQDLNISYDVLVRDGSIPGSNFSDVWLRMFETLATQPELAQNFDIVKIFKHIARNSGAKNVNEFVRRGGNINPQTMGNDQIMQGLQAGNLSPLGG